MTRTYQPNLSPLAQPEPSKYNANFYYQHPIIVNSNRMNIQQISSLVSCFDPRTGQGNLNQVCSQVLRRKFNSTQQQCSVHFTVSSALVQAANNPEQAENVLVELLDLDLSARSRLQCLGRLIQLKLTQGKLKEAISFQKQCINIMQKSDVSEQKSMQYLLLWILCGFNNLDSCTPQSNLVLAYIHQGNDNIGSSVILLKKALQQSPSLVDTKFIKWKINRLVQTSQPQRFKQMDNTLKYIYGYFCNIEEDTLGSDMETEKKRVLAHLKTIFNKYSQSQQHQQQLDYLEQQISSLQRVTLPSSLYNTLDATPIQTFNKSLTKLPPNYPRQNEVHQGSIGPTKNIQTNFVNSSRSVSFFNPLSNWKGSLLIKLHFNNNGSSKRHFYLDKSSESRMYYCDQGDKPDPSYDSHYSLEGIIRVEQGKYTEVQRRKSNADYPSQLSFSVVYSERTRDFVALNAIDYSNWVFSLRQIVQHQGKPGSPTRSAMLSNPPTTPENKLNYGSVLLRRKY